MEGAKPGNEKKPSRVVPVVRMTPCRASATEMASLGMTAPEATSIVPERDAEAAIRAVRGRAECSL